MANFTLLVVTSGFLALTITSAEIYKKNGMGMLAQIQVLIRFLRAIGFNFLRGWEAFVWEWKNQWENSWWKAGL